MKLHTLIFGLSLSLGSHMLQAEPTPEPSGDIDATEQEIPAGSSKNSGDDAASEEQRYLAWAKGIWQSLDRQTGEIQLPNGVATLNVPDEFYYLNPSDAQKVLVEVWGNPPGQERLGMLFPADMTPFDNGAWAVTVDYDEEGYISDDDANEIDYSELLTQMKEDVRDASKERVNNGYAPIELVGWAAPPYYDKTTHKLHWAKEIKFGTDEVNTLNYNIRVLGRKGVLVLNFIAGMDQKEVIDQQLNRVLAMANFNEGSRYEDFNPDIDTVAAYGIGALIAGKVAAKTGLIAAALILLKKFGVFIFVFLAALFGKLFKRKQTPAA